MISKTISYFAILASLLLAGESVRAGRPFEQGRSLQSVCYPTSGTDYYGGDIFNYPILHLGSATACCNKCYQTTGCKAYIYRTDHDHCWLKNVVNPSSNCPYCSGEILYLDPSPSPSPTCSPTHGKDYFGGDLHQGPIEYVTSAQECCDICKGTDGCVAYTWRSDYNHCWPKSTVSTLIDCPTCYTQKFH